MAEWKHGLFECMESMGDCCLGYWCPCVQAYVANKAAGEEPIMGILQLIFYPLLVPVLRNKVRETKGIDGSLVGDMCAGWCCGCCTTIQIKREFD